MPIEPAVRFRVDTRMKRGLDRLRTEKAINVSAWLRRLVQQGLETEFPDLETFYAAKPEPTDSTAESDDALKPDPSKPPVEGWKPRQLDRGWCAVLEGERVAKLPDSDQLPGTPIIVTDRRGDSWTTTLKEVVSRSDTEIIVTNSGRPRS
jgi:hypothetical protein